MVEETKDLKVLKVTKVILDLLVLEVEQGIRVMEDLKVVKEEMVLLG